MSSEGKRWTVTGWHPVAGVVLEGPGVEMGIKLAEACEVERLTEALYNAEEFIVTVQTWMGGPDDKHEALDDLHDALPDSGRS